MKDAKKPTMANTERRVTRSMAKSNQAQPQVNSRTTRSTAKREREIDHPIVLIRRQKKPRIEPPASERCMKITEMIKSILDYVPPIDVQRFRRVSKQWIAVIDDPVWSFRDPLFLDSKAQPLRDLMYRERFVGVRGEYVRRPITVNTAIFHQPHSFQTWKQTLWLQADPTLFLDDDPRLDMLLTYPPPPAAAIALELKFSADVFEQGSYTVRRTQALVMTCIRKLYGSSALRCSHLVTFIREAKEVIRGYKAEPVLDLAQTEISLETVRFTNAAQGPPPSRKLNDYQGVEYHIEDTDVFVYWSSTWQAYYRDFPPWNHPSLRIKQAGRGSRV